LRTGAVVAWHCVLTLGVSSTRPVQRYTLINVNASLEWVSSVVLLAGASKAANSVRTDSVSSTRLLLAFIDIYKGRRNSVTMSPNIQHA